LPERRSGSEIFAGTAFHRVPAPLHPWSCQARQTHEPCGCFSDNDARFYDNCARHYRGAWWFSSCFQSHLNGIYYQRGSHRNYFVRNGIQWNTVHPYSSLRRTLMMVRRNADRLLDNGVE